MAKDFPICSTAAKTGNKGMRMVEEVVNDGFGWILRSQADQSDLGIDAHIEVLGNNGEAYGKLLAAQIKCGKSFFKTSDADGYIFYGEWKHLNYYINYSLPVIIILCDPDADQCWWSHVNPLETEPTKTGWKITVPFNQHFDISAMNTLMELAGPSQDYHNELGHYWRVNEMLTMPWAIVHIVIAREDIEKQDIDRVLTVLHRFRSSKKVVRSNCERLTVSVLGYENDIRELYEIPEVRVWFGRVCDRFPYWFYFLSKETGGLKLIATCISPYVVISKATKQSEGQVVVDTTGLGPFLTMNFIGLNELCYLAGIDENESRAISDRAVLTFLPKDDDYPSS